MQIYPVIGKSIIVYHCYILFIVFSLIFNNVGGFRSKFSRCSRNGGCLTMMVGSKDFDFLTTKEQSDYIDVIFQRSVQETKTILRNKELSPIYLEVSFPESRRPDLGAAESFDISRDFAKSFIQSIATTFSFSKDAWLLFPDKKESLLGKQSSSVSYTTTSIIGAYEYLSKQQNQQLVDSSSTLLPKIIVAVSPGFNVDEWIQLAKLVQLPILNKPETSPIVVVINGNLDRLRNGYYPRLFYPGLFDATQQVYQYFQPAFILQPLAISGDRFAGYVYQDIGQQILLVRNPTNARQYDILRNIARTKPGTEADAKSKVVSETDKKRELSTNQIYEEVRRAYLSARNTLF